VNLRQVLDPQTISLNLAGATKQAIIEELLDMLIRAGKLSNREEALKAVLERESKMSTAIQNGVAIPHAKTDSVNELVTAVGLKPKGVDFQSLDGKLTHIFILTLSPQSKLGPHIQFLSALSQSLDEPAVRRALLRARTSQEIVDLLTA
jgi:fructose-specific phosphotransferase system IIA component